MVFSEREVTGEYANVAAEHRRDMAILRGSALAWTVLAAPILNDDPGSGSYDAVIDGGGPGQAISRADYAAALLDALARDGWIGHAVGVANPPSDDSSRARPHGEARRRRGEVQPPAISCILWTRLT